MLGILHGLKPGTGRSAKRIANRLVPPQNLLWHAPRGRVSIRRAVQDAGGTRQGDSKVIAIRPPALGMVVAAAGKKIVPGKIIGAGRRCLVHGI